MIAESQTEDELNLDKPISPQELGKWIFHPRRPLQRLATHEDVQPWQIAFFAGWESFVRQSHHTLAHPRTHPNGGFLSRKSHLKRETPNPSMAVIPEPLRGPRTIYDALAILGAMLLAVSILFATRS